MIQVPLAKAEGTIRIVLSKMMTGVIPALEREMTRQSKFLTDLTVTRFMSSTSNSKFKQGVSVRSGFMRNTTVPQKTRKIGNNLIIGGVQFGAHYARIHVGPKGKVTSISKSKGFMAIPVGGALSNTGARKYWTPQGLDLHPVRSGSGYLLVKVDRRYKKNWRLWAAWTPMFLLRRSVQVPARIHPEEVWANARSEVLYMFKDAILRSIRGYGWRK